MSSEKIKNDIPLAALGRLSKAEELELEAALAEDPQFAAELREHEEIIAGLWHSAAPLQTMPRSAWGELQERLHDESKKASPKTTSPLTPWIGALGWAAAITLGVYLLMGDHPADQAPPQAEQLEPGAPRTITRIIDSAPGASEIEIRIRERLKKVQQKLATALAERDSATLASQVIELYPPGESSIDNPELRSQRLLKLLTEALGHNLQRLDEEAVSLIIEEGWLDVALQSLPHDAKIRHRTFPVDHFDQYGLLRSPEGEYFDPASKFLWKPAPDGGGYLGSLASEDLDLSQFSGAPEVQNEEDSPHTETLLADLPPAQGYLVRNEAGGNPSFVLNGVNPYLDLLSIRQGDSTAYLEPPSFGLAPSGGISTGANRTGSSVAGSSIRSSANPVVAPIISTPQGPQLMEVANSYGDTINWNAPFEVVQVDAQGNESVILTTQP